MDNENDKLQLLLDRAEISDVQLRYATGLDSRNWPLFRSCFTRKTCSATTRIDSCARPPDGKFARAS
jgi:hypothetical protein